MMMIIRSHRFRFLFFGAQRVHLGLDRRRAQDSRLRDLDPLFGRHYANDALDRGPPLGARSAHEERDLEDCRGRCRSACAGPSSGRRPVARRAWRFFSSVWRQAARERPACFPSVVGRVCGRLAIANLSYTKKGPKFGRLTIPGNAMPRSGCPNRARRPALPLRRSYTSPWGVGTLGTAQHREPPNRGAEGLRQDWVFLHAFRDCCA